MAKGERHGCCGAVEISENEYLQLTMKVPPDNRYEKFKNEKERLRKISAKRASQWPNTLINLRLLREQARRDRIKKEEQDILRQDNENRIFRHQERLEKIDKANGLLERLHVKTLQSKAWITDVAKERIEQLKITKILKDKYKNKEKYFHNELLKTVAKLNQAEEDKAKEAQANKQLWIKAQDEQVAMVRARLLKEKEEILLERDRLNKFVQDANEKEAAKMKAKKDKLLAGYKEVADINKSVQGNEGMIAAREKKLEEDIAAYWTKRKAWEAGLKKMKDDETAVKRKHEDVMADRLDKLYKAVAVKIESNERKHQLAKEKADDEYAAAKEAKAKALLAECHKSRQLQIKKKKEREEEEKKNIADEDKMVAKYIQQLNEEEKQEEIERYKYNRKIADFCIDQKNAKLKAQKIAKETAMHEEIEALIQLQEDEDYLKNLRFE